MVVAKPPHFHLLIIEVLGSLLIGFIVAFNDFHLLVLHRLPTLLTPALLTQLLETRVVFMMAFEVQSISVLQILDAQLGQVLIEVSLYRLLRFLGANLLPVLVFNRYGTKLASFLHSRNIYLFALLKRGGGQTSAKIRTRGNEELGLREVSHSVQILPVLLVLLRIQVKCALRMGGA